MSIHGLAPRPIGPDQCPNPGSSRAEDRARIRVNGGSGPPFLLDHPHPSDQERATAEAPGRSTLTSRAPSRSPPAARPGCARRSRSLRGDDAAAGGAIGGADDELEGQAPCGTRVVAVIVVLLVLAWSSPGAAGWFGTARRRPRRRRNDAAVKSPGEQARRSPRYGPRERPREQRGAADGRRCSRMGGTE